MQAQCQCGQLTASLSSPTDQIVACYCIDCQRRSGSPFGVIAYYRASAVELSGRPVQFTRQTDTGNTFSNCFCPECGSTVWCTTGSKPGWVGIPVGIIADPAYPAPVRSVWEQAKHAWVEMPENIHHFPKGRS